MNIGDRIRNKRIELDMSMKDLANKLNVNRSTIYRYETGAIEKMPIGVIKPIANALNTSVSYLMGWDEEEIEAVSQMQADVRQAMTEDEERILKYIKKFEEENGNLHFTEEELQKIYEYALFIVHTRK